MENHSQNPAWAPGLPWELSGRKNFPLPFWALEVPVTGDKGDPIPPGTWELYFLLSGDKGVQSHFLALDV